MARLFSLVVLGSLVVGCATSANYEKILNTWVGTDLDQLVQAWGPPQDTYALTSGGKVLEYFRSGSVQVGGYSYTQPETTHYSGQVSAYGAGGATYGTWTGNSTTMVQKTTPIRNLNLWCRTIFNTDQNGVIRNWQFEGNNCVAKLPESSKEEINAVAETRTIVIPEGVLIKVMSRTDQFGASLKTLMQGDKVKIVGEEGMWFRVVIDESQFGWVKKADLY